MALSGWQFFLIAVIFISAVIYLFRSLRMKRINTGDEEVVVDEKLFKKMINKPILWYLAGDERLLDKVEHHTLFVFTRIREENEEVTMIVSPIDCQEIKKGTFKDTDAEYIIKIKSNQLKKLARLSPHRDIWIAEPTDVKNLDVDLAGTLLGQIYIKKNSELDHVQNLLMQAENLNNSLNMTLQGYQESLKAQSKGMAEAVKEAQSQPPQRQFGNNDGGEGR